MKMIQFTKITITIIFLFILSITKSFSQHNKGTEFCFTPPSERFSNEVSQLLFTGYYDAPITIDWVARPCQHCFTQTLQLIG